MKNKLMAIALLCSASTASNAANYIISNVADGVSDTLYASSNNTISPTGIVTLGVFAAGFDVAGNLGDYAALVNNFTIFASGAIGGSSSSLGGSFAGYTEYEPIDGSPLLTGNALIGRTLYSFIGDGATLGGSVEMALISMGLLQNEDGGELDFASNPQLRAGDPLIGSLGSATGNLGGQGEGTYVTLKMTAVPEPSAALLGAIGALGLLRRRRI